MNDSGDLEKTSERPRGKGKELWKGPGEPQEVPGEPQKGPRRPQDRPKMVQRWPKTAPRPCRIARDDSHS